jgi:hypothetical protein
MPRRPQDSDYYRFVEDYFETFVQIYDKYFSRHYGFGVSGLRVFPQRFFSEKVSVTSGKAQFKFNLIVVDKVNSISTSACNVYFLIASIHATFQFVIIKTNARQTLSLCFTFYGQYFIDIQDHLSYSSNMNK